MDIWLLSGYFFSQDRLEILEFGEQVCEWKAILWLVRQTDVYLTMLKVVSKRFGQAAIATKGFLSKSANLL